ncbi:MAG TPA: hypothetical protein DCY13_13135 [Verrucomicrobiales bacterium]|nr:hypothetical protein [Verrucomicrobiales bacterium]
MKTTPLIVLALVGVLVGLGFVFPAISHWRQEGSITVGSLMLFLLGLGLTVAGLFSGAQGIKRLKN